MVETSMSFALSNPICLQRSPFYPLHSNTVNNTNSSKLVLKQCSISKFGSGLLHQTHHELNLSPKEQARAQAEKSGRGEVAGKVNALPNWPLMAVLVDHMQGQGDFITHKSIWHLSDKAIKNVYTFYIMFTCWGCCFFGAAKDPFYDSEQYRGEGGDGTGHWVYEKQEDIEESARAALWREELIEEIEQKVGGLRELEDVTRKEEQELVNK